MQRCIKLAFTRAIGLGLGVRSAGFGLLRKREDPGGKSLLGGYSNLVHCGRRSSYVPEHGRR
jgi:hypothetical protein